MNPSKQAKTRDIAEAAGVSTATVSRVFSRHPYVSEEIRQKVLAATTVIMLKTRISFMYLLLVSAILGAFLCR